MVTQFDIKARPFPRAFEWAQILVEEFACQGDLERELGLPVLPMNDRSKIVLEDSQIGFIKFIALGLFESIHGYMQGKVDCHGNMDDHLNFNF